MNIYEAGEEKCINGIWGREVNGRFYTHYFESTDCLTLYRKIDVDNEENDWFVSVKVGAHLESVVRIHVCTKQSWLTKYVPKHIKDLENLKRGDIVWVNIDNLWSPVVFYGLAVSTKYCCTRSYKEQDCVGSLDDILLINEVHLKPPFDLHQ